MNGLNLVKGQRTEIGLTHVRVALKWEQAGDSSNPFEKKEEGVKGFFGKMFKKGTDLVNSAMEGEEKRPDFDVDSSVLQLTNGKLPNTSRMVYYGGPIKEGKHIFSENRSIHHHGDNRTGGSVGDDEIIDIYLSDLPKGVDELVIPSNIYECVKNGQHFGMLQNAYIRLLNPVTNEELCRFNLTDLSGYTALVVARIYKNEQGAWMFHAIGEPTKDPDLQSLIKRWQ